MSPLNKLLTALESDIHQMYSLRLLFRAQEALKAKKEESARLYLGLGQLLAPSRVDYLIRSARLWLKFGFLTDTYENLLELEVQASNSKESKLLDLLERTLLEFEQGLARRYSRQDEGIRAAIWQCLAAERIHCRWDSDFSSVWQQLPRLDGRTRAVQAVVILGILAYQGFDVRPGYAVARGYLESEPKVLREIWPIWSQLNSLRCWPSLWPVTSPWIEVLEAVLGHLNFQAESEGLVALGQVPWLSGNCITPGFTGRDEDV